MSQTTLVGILNSEIETLNKRIDRKILKGRSYYKDSIKHQVLIAQYRRIQARKRINATIQSFATA